MEPTAGYVLVAEQLYNKGCADNDSWNFGPHISDIRSVKEIVELFYSSWGTKQAINCNVNSNEPHEAKSLSLDISKACLNLNWSPKWNVERAIEETSDWYKSYHENKDVLRLCIEQIEDYFSN